MLVPEYIRQNLFNHKDKDRSYYDHYQRLLHPQTAGQQ